MASGQWHAKEGQTVRYNCRQSQTTDVVKTLGARLREHEVVSRNLGHIFLTTPVRGHLGANSLIKRACRRKK